MDLGQDSLVSRLHHIPVLSDGTVSETGICDVFGPCSRRSLRVWWCDPIYMSGGVDWIAADVECAEGSLS